MSTVLENTEGLMLSGEALDQFELPGGLLPGQAEEAESGVSRHAVLVGNIGLLLPDDEISELVERARVCRLPNTSTWFSGITSVRGSMIPVFDLHELFDIVLPPTPRRLIVVGENEKAVAFWVDDFPRIVGLEADQEMTAEPPLPALIREHARRYYQKDEQIWVDWNVETFAATLGAML